MERSGQEHIVLNVISSENTRASMRNTSSPTAFNYLRDYARQQIDPQRRSIPIEGTITVCHIIASLIVLALSRNENPHTPLRVWIVGYSSACLLSLLLLYWRYTYRFPLFVKLFQIALESFFTIWLFVGYLWIFGGRSSSSDAPNLHRLCIVLFTLNWINYVVIFILCCFVLCLHYATRRRGASSKTIGALPKYKFKTNKSNGSKDDSQSSCEDGIMIAAGTQKERSVSAEDAICCICLGKYEDDEDLRELLCAHHFHVECVDEWLKINAACPLCKCKI